jgi:hypothetical protein
MGNMVPTLPKDQLYYKESFGQSPADKAAVAFHKLNCLLHLTKAEWQGSTVLNLRKES